MTWWHERCEGTMTPVDVPPYKVQCPECGKQLAAYYQGGHAFVGPHARANGWPFAFKMTPERLAIIEHVEQHGRVWEPPG